MTISSRETPRPEDLKRRISVVVCARNEAARIADCLASVVANAPDEIIVVDGNSEDDTVAIAGRYTDHIVVSENSNLTRDRQIGIDATGNSLIAMIDADHRLKPDDLESLKKDIYAFNLDIVQAAIDIAPNSFWCRAEGEALDLVQNSPGEKGMIGVAPALFKRHVFKHVRFDDTITRTIDDTDFMYRLSRTGCCAIGTGETRITQSHFGEFASYLQKFRWYGKGDGEFCIKHPERAGSMIFHLAVRYPLLHAGRALLHGKPRAFVYFILQGTVRFGSAIWTLARRPRG